MVKYRNNETPGITEQNLHKPTAPICELCGKALYLGQFAYDQCICWECFCENMRKIRDNIQHLGLIPYLDHVMAVFSEQFFYPYKEGFKSYLKEDE